MIELDRPRLHELPASESADPIVVNPEGAGDFGLLADPVPDLLAGFFYPFLYLHA